MQVCGRRHTPRVLASITGLWLVIATVLAARHEAQVIHVVDGSGHSFHASRMVGHHTTEQSDIHASGAAPDHDACELAASLHQAASAACSRPDVVHAGRTTIASAAPTTARSTLAERVYRLAPKTSPPVVA